MDNSGRIYFLLPGLLWQAGIQQLNRQRIQRPKQLSKILSRATITSSNNDSLNASIFKQFGVVRESGRDLPIAAVSLLGLGQEVDENDCWGFASPVHLLTDRDRLILVNLGHHQEYKIAKEEADRMVSCFSSYYVTGDYSLYAVTPEDWYIRLKDCPKLRTSDIDIVTGKSIERYLPRGDDEIKFISLLNEVQMLFYQGNLNSPHIRNDKLRINSIWFSGFGKLPKIESDYTSIYSNSAVMKGLAKLSDCELYEVPDDLTALARVDGNLLVLLMDMFENELVGNPTGWMDALSCIDDMFYNLVRSSDLSHKRVIIIDTCDGELFSLTKQNYSRAFYKLSKKLSEFR